MNAEPFYTLLDFPGASHRLRELAADFARDAHSTWPDLADIYPLPKPLLQRAAATGVTGIGIDSAYGGQGGGHEDICACAAEDSFWSQSVGLGLSLFMHQLIAHFSIGTLATPEQKQEYLPKLASGGMLAAQAVSEAKSGGNPGHMKTKSERDGNRWLLSGDKTFVTNGPAAGLFITLAVTGQKDERKEFSTFLVPADYEGVAVKDIGPLPFLRPAPHGSVRFNEVQLSDHNLLGEQGKALDFFARPFAALEDVLVSGLLAGSFAALFMCLCRDIAQAEQSTSEKQKLAGRLQSGLASFANFAGYGASMANTPGFTQKSRELSRTIRGLSLFNLSLLHQLAQNVPLEHDSKALFTDAEKLLAIRGRHADIREEKAGKELLSR